MQKSQKTGVLWAAWGAFFCAAAVILAAAGDHLVAKDVGAKALHVYDIANRFQFYQGLGLIVLGLAAAQWGERRLWTWTGVLMLLGLLLFSGGLYLVAILGRQYAFLAPIGGSAMILSWLVFAFGLWRCRSEPGR